MDDKDHVFARFKDDKPEASNRREMLTVPRRAGASGSRVVEVVHVRSGGAIKDRPRRSDPSVRAASWEGGFPAKQAITAPDPVEPVAIGTAEPTTHVMPAWEPGAAKAPSPAPAPQMEERRGRGRRRNEPAAAPSRDIADPFDMADDRANCLRCGYAIESAREKRGLMTCGACG